MSRNAAALLVLAAFLGAGCREKSAPARFPIGIYNVADPKLLQPLREDGFDSVFAEGPSLEVMAKEAKRLGMRLLVSPNSARPAKEVAGWPIEAWYLVDEPDVNNVTPQQLEDISRRTREWDKRAQAFCIGQGPAAERYAKTADILMLDWYPVPHLKLDSVADHMDEASRHLPPGKPLWMVVQAFDWRDAPQKDPKKPRIGRFPDHAEIRFMSYLAIVHGAKGLYYYTLQRPMGLTLYDYPELWQAVARVTRELESFKPILEGGTRAPLPFPPDPDGPETRAWDYHGRQYVVILNRKETKMQKVPDELLERRWRPLYEVRRDPKELLAKVGRAWYLKPYQVMVFESDLSLSRLFGR